MFHADDLPKPVAGSEPRGVLAVVDDAPQIAPGGSPSSDEHCLHKPFDLDVLESARVARLDPAADEARR